MRCRSKETELLLLLHWARLVGRMDRRTNLHLDRRGAIRMDGSFSLLLAMTRTSRASLASSNRWRALHDSFAVPAARDGDANKCRRCWTISSIRRASRASTVWFLAHGVMCTLHEHRNASFPPHDQHVRELRLIHFVVTVYSRLHAQPYPSTANRTPAAAAVEANSFSPPVG